VQYAVKDNCLIASITISVGRVGGKATLELRSFSDLLRIHHLFHSASSPIIIYEVQCLAELNLVMVPCFHECQYNAITTSRELSL
jgi:hypothetical protein